MDIMLPKLDQQVSPPPWLVRRRAVSVRQLLRTLLHESPDLSVDDAVARLKELGVQASGIIVAMWLRKERGSRFTSSRPAAIVASEAPVGRRRERTASPGSRRSARPVGHTNEHFEAV